MSNIREMAGAPGFPAKESDIFKPLRRLTNPIHLILMYDTLVLQFCTTIRGKIEKSRCGSVRLKISVRRVEFSSIEHWNAEPPKSHKPIGTVQTDLSVYITRVCLANLGYNACIASKALTYQKLRRFRVLCLERRGGEGGILPQSPQYIDRIGLIEPGRTFSDTLNDTKNDARPQETG